MKMKTELNIAVQATTARVPIYNIETIIILLVILSTPVAVRTIDT